MKALLLIVLALSSSFANGTLVNERQNQLTFRALEDQLNDIRRLMTHPDLKRRHEAYGHLVEVTNEFVLRSVRDLPDFERVVAIKYFLHEKQENEIAVETQKSEMEIRRALWSAVSKLREIFVEDNLGAPFPLQRENLFVNLAKDFTTFISVTGKAPQEKSDDDWEAALAHEVRFAGLNPEFRNALGPQAMPYYCRLELSM